MRFWFSDALDETRASLESLEVMVSENGAKGNRKMDTVLQVDFSLKSPLVAKLTTENDYEAGFRESDDTTDFWENDYKAELLR